MSINSKLTAVTILEFVLAFGLVQNTQALQPSPGCQHSNPRLTRGRLLTLKVESQSRSYVLDSTGSADSKGSESRAPRPVVFVFHGSGANVNDSQALGFEGVARELRWNSFFVYPQGILVGTPPDIGWDLVCGSRDQSFFRLLLQDLANKQCLDLDRVFVAGFSWGADMAHSLACCQAHSIRALAPLSGSDVFANPVSKCQTPGVAALLQYGTDDSAYSQEDFKRATEFYVTRNHCSSLSEPVPNQHACLTGKSCDLPFMVCAIPDQIHEVKKEEVVRAIGFFQTF